MTPIARRSAPGLRTVLSAQLQAVALATTHPAGVVIALAALALITVDAFLGNAFHPEHHTLPGLFGLLLPIGVWMGEDRFGPGLLWTLPVDRLRHTLVRLLAGWLWLMGAIAVFVVWLLAVTLIAGGTVLADETFPVLRSFSFTSQGTFAPDAVQPVRFTPNPLFWLVPFSAATSTYLLSSALTLATAFPLRWIAGVLIVGFVVSAAADETSLRDVIRMGHMVDALVRGRYGLDTLLTARTESLQVSATFSTGETKVVWSGLPVASDWAAATLLWIGIGAAALAAAASRHRETRRA